MTSILVTHVTQEKSKKSFTWYLQPWKWKTQKSRPQLTLEIEPERRNSGNNYNYSVIRLYIL